MFVLEGNIRIGKFTFHNLHEVEITKSVDNLSATAILKFPNNFKVKQSGEELFTEEAFKVGDTVTITIGYNGKYSGVEFRGFVQKIKPTIPLVIECEDAIGKLRMKNITKAWNKGTTLREVLKEIVKDTNISLAENIPTVHLEKYIIKNSNGAKELQTIKKNMAMNIFLNDKGKLCCTLQQLTNMDKKAVVYDLNYNIVSNDLEYYTVDNRRIKIRYTYIGKDNTKKQIEIGDNDGELHTFHTSVVSDEVKLKEMAQAEIERLKYRGYKGGITSFLIPYATQGMSAKIIDKEHINREGTYFIKKVVTTFGINGARRKVTLGAKI